MALPAKLRWLRPLHRQPQRWPHLQWQLLAPTLHLLLWRRQWRLSMAEVALRQHQPFQGPFHLALDHLLPCPSPTPQDPTLFCYFCFEELLHKHCFCFDFMPLNCCV